VFQVADLALGVALGPVGATAVLDGGPAFTAQAIEPVVQFAFLRVGERRVAQLVLNAARLAVALFGAPVSAVPIRYRLAQALRRRMDQLAVGIGGQEVARGGLGANPGIAIAQPTLAKAAVRRAVQPQPLGASGEIGCGVGRDAGLGAGLGVFVQAALRIARLAVLEADAGPVALQAGLLAYRRATGQQQAAGQEWKPQERTHVKNPPDDVRKLGRCDLNGQ
jgi:hypothetical protein